MNQFTLIDGINLATVGIVVVFLVLLLLMIAIELTAKLVNPTDRTVYDESDAAISQGNEPVNKHHIAIISTILDEELDSDNYRIKVIRKKEVKKND